MVGTCVSTCAGFTGGGGEMTPDGIHVVVDQLALTTKQLPNVKPLRLRSAGEALLLLASTRLYN
jgi:hypothetical protein